MVTTSNLKRHVWPNLVIDRRERVGLSAHLGVNRTMTSTAESGSDSRPQGARKPLYEGSTQFQHWRFSQRQLVAARESLNGAAVAIIKNAFEIEEVRTPDSDGKSVIDWCAKPGSSANVSFLSAEEECLLVKLYVEKISQLCGHFRFPEEVEATAVSYLKRFYLKNTVMDWHPKNVM